MLTEPMTPPHGVLVFTHTDPVYGNIELERFPLGFEFRVKGKTVWRSFGAGPTFIEFLRDLIREEYDAQPSDTDPSDWDDGVKHIADRVLVYLLNHDTAIQDRVIRACAKVLTGMADFPGASFKLTEYLRPGKP